MTTFIFNAYDLPRRAGEMREYEITIDEHSSVGIPLNALIIALLGFLNMYAKKTGSVNSFDCLINSGLFRILILCFEEGIYDIFY